MCVNEGRAALSEGPVREPGRLLGHPGNFPGLHQLFAVPKTVRHKGFQRRLFLAVKK